MSALMQAVSSQQPAQKATNFWPESLRTLCLSPCHLANVPHMSVEWPVTCLAPGAALWACSVRFLPRALGCNRVEKGEINTTWTERTLKTSTFNSGIAPCHWHPKCFCSVTTKQTWGRKWKWLQAQAEEYAVIDRNTHRGRYRRQF